MSDTDFWLRVEKINPKARREARYRIREDAELIRDTIRALAEAIAANHACYDDEYYGYFFHKRTQDDRGTYWEPPGRGYDNPDRIEAHLLSLLKTEE